MNLTQYTYIKSINRGLIDERKEFLSDLYTKRLCQNDITPKQFHDLLFIKSRGLRHNFRQH